MKRHPGLGIAMLAGAAIGAAGVSVLHAQAKPAVYQVTLQEVSDAAALEEEFVPIARPTVRAHGGRALASSANPIPLEGPPPKFRVVINQWDSVEQVKACNASADYQAREIGNK
jgi:uncharacterized protein (DUF1330 family)